MTQDLDMALIVRDGLFLKDGRGWATSSLGRASVLSWPFPSTIKGALRTALGFELERRQGALFKPEDWLTRTELELKLMLPLRKRVDEPWERAQLLLPRPADALYTADKIVRLKPQPPAAKVHTLSDPAQPELETLWRALPEDKLKPIAGPPWWSSERLVQWLTQAPLTPLSPEERALLSPSFQQRMHVTIERETQTADEGKLFSTTNMEPLLRHEQTGLIYEWAIGLRAALPQELSGLGLGAARLSAGGKRKMASTQPLAPQSFALPQALVKAFETQAPKGLRLMLATPAHFERGWCPDGISWDTSKAQWRGELFGHEVILRAAIVDRPSHVSGWDVARWRPKPTLRLAPAGSVYFFERADGQPWSAAHIQDMWLAQLGQSTKDGYGVVVPGCWTL